MADANTPLVVGIPRETFPDESRVAAVPKTIGQLTKAGCRVLVENEAGFAAGFTNESYTEKGAELVDTRDAIFSQADIVLQVRAGGANPSVGQSDLELCREGQILIAMCDPLSEPQAIEQLAGRGVSAFAMELLPRITRAQSMDVLSSMATIAGYKAVLLAANTLPQMFPMLMTAAGTVSAAKVFIVGAGVAGLQAIATAKRLGAIVRAYDVRSAVKEQVESLGGKFVEFDLQSAEGQGGYAKAMDEEFYRKQREMMLKVVAENDVVITTAAVPGKKAPTLITTEMVHAMAPGSVVVDVAAERGGNCELTQPGETVVENGVQILGPMNLPSAIPKHASEMYAKNLATFLIHLKKTVLDDGELSPNVEDEIIRETLITHGGQVTNDRVRELLNPTPSS